VSVGNDATLEDRARAYGLSQGQGLAALGVNLNFGPVVDLNYPDNRPSFDTHTRLGERTISGDAETVTKVARAYAEGLLARGVMPTLKHFPGLGRVAVDTHHMTGRINSHREELADTDWRPFRNLTGAGAAIMVGHVVLEDLDPALPASMSHKVIAGLLRKEWGFDGVIVTDDINMGAVYRRGVGKVATAALNAGVDLVLVSYDPDQYYRAMYEAATAYRQGRLKKSRLDASRHRLDKALQQQANSVEQKMAGQRQDQRQRKS
jgi:beta-N-acetylhexosaminidase